MIGKSDGELVATCEECGGEFFGGTQDDFRAFVQELKEEGWKIQKTSDGAWEHFCEDCKNEIFG